MYLRELVKDGYVGQMLSVNMTMQGSGVLTRTSDRTWQRDFSLGANTLTITFGHAIDALCMVVGELTEVSAIVATQVPQWLETDTKKYVDVTSPDNIMLVGRLEGGAVVNAYVGVHPYHGSGYRLEIYGKNGTLAMIGGGEAGQEAKRKIVGGHKDDKTLQELPVPDRLKWVPQEVRDGGASYDVGQMWVKFAEAIRTMAEYVERPIIFPNFFSKASLSFGFLRLYSSVFPSFKCITALSSVISKLSAIVPMLALEGTVIVFVIRSSTGSVIASAVTALASVMASVGAIATSSAMPHLTSKAFFSSLIESV
jgi:hypothetical protein